MVFNSCYSDQCSCLYRLVGYQKLVIVHISTETYAAGQLVKKLIYSQPHSVVVRGRWDDFSIQCEILRRLGPGLVRSGLVSVVVIESSHVTGII